MEKITTFDSGLTAHWREAFKLNYHWGVRVPSMIAAAMALSTLSHLAPSGYYLAKQRLEVRDFALLNQELILQGEITKKLKSLICRTEVAFLGETVLSMLSVLIKPDAKPAAGNLPAPGSIHSYNDCRSWRTFSRDEVEAFASLSGDTNEIHRGDYPVVPGMLLLLSLEDYLASKDLFFGNAEVLYRKPVRINVPVKLYQEEKTLVGIADNSVCFQVNFQEE